MEIAKMTSKGQLTIPKDVRSTLNLQTGDKVVFIERNGGFFITSAMSAEVSPVNVNGIVASMAVEDLIVTDQMRAYARQRISGRKTYEEKLAEIMDKYANVR